MNQATQLPLAQAEAPSAPRSAMASRKRWVLAAAGVAVLALGALLMVVVLNANQSATTSSSSSPAVAAPKKVAINANNMVKRRSSSSEVSRECCGA